MAGRPAHATASTSGVFDELCFRVSERADKKVLKAVCKKVMTNLGEIFDPTHSYCYGVMALGA